MFKAKNVGVSIDMVSYLSYFIYPDYNPNLSPGYKTVNIFIIISQCFLPQVTTSQMDFPSALAAAVSSLTHLIHSTRHLAHSSCKARPPIRLKLTRELSLFHKL